MVIGHGYRIRFRFARWARSIRLGAIREPLVLAGGTAKMVPTTAARTAPARFVPSIRHSSPGLGAIVHWTAVPTVQGLPFSYALHPLPPGRMPFRRWRWELSRLCSGSTEST
jgi:hypothetical protein